MKILFYTDVHLTDTFSFPEYNKMSNSGLQLGLENILKGFDFITSRIDHHKPDLVVNLGDTFHDTLSVATRVLHATDRAFTQINSKLHDYKNQHVILAGNHDIISNNSFGVVSSASILSQYGSVLSEPHTIQFGDTSIGFIPYISNDAEYLSNYMRMLPQCDYIFTHYDCRGAQQDNGRIIEHSLIASDHVTGNRCKRVLSGHQHTPHDVGMWSFVGALVRQTFYSTDSDVYGCIGILDTDTNEFFREQNSMSKHALVLKDLDKAKQLDMGRFIVQTRIPETREVVNEVLEGLNIPYHYIPQISKVDDSEKLQYIASNLDQNHLLKNFVNKDNPEAFNLLEELLEHS